MLSAVVAKPEVLVQLAAQPEETVAQSERNSKSKEPLLEVTLPGVRSHLQTKAASAATSDQILVDARWPANNNTGLADENRDSDHQAVQAR